ncbi:AAA family ATPase [Sorangium cellulosum]|uniref:ATPase AAA-type core domain-containing protein n=1 Tax=Sorangium cellulosum So0157-2 TaxID=1254432 RepID=S4XRS6_SORCE|nr:AAA family ATPase [Sorangium cellulosum]AGP35086.1 hypothetical protein SCE1572_11525 [Sorangium cellulosum So0157-2]
MTIASFWAKGYRSLRDVRVDDLGPFNIFYGPNGSGKSNLLEALRTLFRLADVIAETGALSGVENALRALDAGVLNRRDVCAHDPSRFILLGARLVAAQDEALVPVGLLPAPELVMEVTVDWTHRLTHAVMGSDAREALDAGNAACVGPR